MRKGVKKPMGYFGKQWVRKSTAATQATPISLSVLVESEKIIDRKSGSKIFQRFKKVPTKKTSQNVKNKVNKVEPQVSNRLRKPRTIKNIGSNSDISIVDESSRMGLR